MERDAAGGVEGHVGLTDTVSVIRKRLQFPGRRERVASLAGFWAHFLVERTSLISAYSVDSRAT